MYLAARVERWPFHVLNPCDGSLQNAPNFLGDPTMTLLAGLHLKQPLRACNMYSTNQVKDRRPEQRSIEASNACINFLFFT